MRIIRLNLEHPYQMKSPVAACIGYFDGLHIGHQELIRRTNELARANHCESALITFDPDPWVTIRHEKNVHHITTMKQRINLSVQFGIQNIFILEFSSEMSQLPPHEFVTKILSMCNLKALVCGFDFRYGYMGAGTPETLAEEHLFSVTVVPPVEAGGSKISSSRISALIEDGSVRQAASLLGYPFTIEGTVGHGNHQGTGLGYPTANIIADPEYLLPKPGVYACYAIVHHQRYLAMVNLGHNPTFNYTESLSLEAHLLDFSGDLYGTRLELQFIDYLREEKKFRSRENLIMQLEQDIQTVRKLLPC